MNLKIVPLIATLLLCSALFAQTPASSPTQPVNLYAAGVTFNNGATPSVAGTGLYAKKVSDSAGTYAFTVVDVLPTSHKPFTVNTNFSAGLAQKLFTMGKVRLYVPTAAGVSYNGANTGWAWSTGGLAVIPLRGNLSILPNVRMIKSSVSRDSGYQLITGFLIGWGK